MINADYTQERRKNKKWKKKENKKFPYKKIRQWEKEK